MASFFSSLFSWLTGRPKAAPPEPTPPPAPAPAVAPAPPAAIPLAGPAQRGPAPILHDYRSPGGSPGKKTGIFTRMIGMKKSGAWQDPLWIPATAELQQLAKQEETRKKILVADSDPVAAADCKAMLETEGFTVETSHDGEDCVEKIFKLNPDVVILRLSLPKINGLDILRRLRQLDDYRRLPVIALAETGAQFNESQALAAGATRVFDRGAATEDDLFLALRTAMRKRVFTPKRQLFQPGSTPVKLGASVIPMPGAPPTAPDLSGASSAAYQSPVGRQSTVPVPLSSPPARPISMPPGPGPSTPPSTASIPFAFETAQANPLSKPAPPPAILPHGGSLPPSTATVPAIASNARRVLLIEDEEMVANIYRARLLRAGYQVEVALDGETGLDRLRQSPPDAVLLDAHLPRMDGLQVLQLIRSDPQLAKLPVILCTAAMNPRMQEEAILAGAVRVLDKTAITPLQVVEAVQSLFAEAKAADITVPANASPSQIRKITTLIPELPPGNTLPDFLPPDDAAFEAEIREAFLQEAPGAVAKIQSDAKSLHRTTAVAPEREQFVISLYKDTHKLAGTAGLAGFSQVSRLASSLEALLTKIQEKPDRLNPSCMRTLVQAVDYIGLLFSRASALRDYAKPEALALVVDDEMIGRRYVAHSLAKADLPYHAASNAVEALKLLQQHRFDIIFLDVEMPGMNGFDLCKHIRTLPGYDKTPCIFVTSLNSFEALSKSKMSGGTDFLAKPFSYAELSVKALTALAKRQMEQLTPDDQRLVAAAAAQLSQHAPA